MAALARLAAEPIATDRELAAFMAGLNGEGAVVSFTGIARPKAKTGETVERLFLDHYPGMTERSLQTIADEGLARFDVSAVAVVHRCGAIAARETIVFVAAASLHRREAFLAADYLMDRLKTEAVFWKREEGVDGARWIEPTPRDHQDAARWSE
jgi:molybdopterin synthase catalytic subunit